MLYTEQGSELKTETFFALSWVNSSAWDLEQELLSELLIVIERWLSFGTEADCSRLGSDLKPHDIWPFMHPQYITKRRQVISLIPLQMLELVSTQDTILCKSQSKSWICESQCAFCVLMAGLYLYSLSVRAGKTAAKCKRKRRTSMSRKIAQAFQGRLSWYISWVQNEQ